MLGNICKRLGVTRGLSYQEMMAEAKLALLAAAAVIDRNKGGRLATIGSISVYQSLQRTLAMQVGGGEEGEGTLSRGERRTVGVGCLDREGMGERARRGGMRTATDVHTQTN